MKEETPTGRNLTKKRLRNAHVIISRFTAGGEGGPYILEIRLHKEFEYRCHLQTARIMYIIYCCNRNL